MIEILPCYFDHAHFYPDEALRTEFRIKYQITDLQKVLLYSGMLQKWQEPDLLFSFFKNIQEQDLNHDLRFMMLTFDLEKAAQFGSKYGLKNVIVHAASDEELNGFYNAADIGVAVRSADMVSFVSSPVKVPEYLSTGNSLIILEYIGDFGLQLKNKDFTLVKKDKSELLRTTIEEVKNLRKPNAIELEEIRNNYSIRSNLAGIKRVLNGTHE